MTKRSPIVNLRDRYLIGGHEEGKEMTNTMAMGRFCEENLNLLRKEERLWRANKAGKVGCASQEHTTVFLTKIQEW